MKCPCHSQLLYQDCCQPLIDQQSPGETCLAVMRSRYAAYALKKIDYLSRTHDPQTQNEFDLKSATEWARSASFNGLEIISWSEERNKGIVEFQAHYTIGEKSHCHHEKSLFRKMNGRWYYRKALPLGLNS